MDLENIRLSEKIKLQKKSRFGKKYDNYVTFKKYTNNTVYDFRIDIYKNKYKYKNMHAIYGNPNPRCL